LPNYTLSYNTTPSHTTHSLFPTRRSSDLGQRIGGVMISDKLFLRRFDDLSSYFVANQLGPALLQEVVYTMSAGVSHSAQYGVARSEEHTSELQSRENLVCRLLLEKRKVIK